MFNDIHVLIRSFFLLRPGEVYRFHHRYSIDPFSRSIWFLKVALHVGEVHDSVVQHRCGVLPRDLSTKIV
jgi:hypothetical protein